MAAQGTPGLFGCRLRLQGEGLGRDLPWASFSTAPPPGMHCPVWPSTATPSKSAQRPVGSSLPSLPSEEWRSYKNLCVRLRNPPLEASAWHCLAGATPAQLLQRKGIARRDASSQQPQSITCWLLGVYRKQGLRIWREEVLMGGLGKSSGHEVVV